MTDYLNEAERDAAIIIVKDLIRDGIRRMERYAADRGQYFTAMPIWIDGLWADYWYCELDGEPCGDIYYDGFGPVIKGDRLGLLAYETMRADEMKANAHLT